MISAIADDLDMCRSYIATPRILTGMYSPLEKICIVGMPAHGDFDPLVWIIINRDSNKHEKPKNIATFLEDIVKYTKLDPFAGVYTEFVNWENHKHNVMGTINNHTNNVK
jgi:hypothetical protein